MNTFEMKTAIHFGDNALDRLKEIPYKRVLIITDPFVVQSKMTVSYTHLTLPTKLEV